MRLVPLVAVFATGCFTFPWSTDLEVETDLPEMDLDCDDLFEEQNGTNGDIVFADVQQVGDVCRGRGFASITAIEWADLNEEVPERARIDWREVLTEITNLTVTANRGPIPAGVTASIEQFVATESGDLADIEGDWAAAVAAIGSRTVEGSDTMLFAASHEFSGSDSENVIDVATVEYNTAGPLATLNQSYAEDDLLKVVTVAVVDVPMEELDVEPTEIRLAVGQAVDFTARVRINLLP